MIEKFRLGIVLTGIMFSAASLGQSTSDLREACFEDIELGNYLTSVASGGPIEDADLFTEAERVELLAKLNDPNLANNTTQEKVKHVLQACASGQILQARNGISSEQ